MSTDLISYRLPGATWTLGFCPDALSIIRDHVQHSRWSKESVGQLYTHDLTGNLIIVEEATILTSILATWARVRFDIKKARKERQTMFERGMHCIGLWHSHPEPYPEPSAIDRDLARNHAMAAQPQLAGIIFAIVGTEPLPNGLKIWIDDGYHFIAAESLACNR